MSLNPLANCQKKSPWSSFICLYVYNKNLKYSRLLGEETENHQAYRRGHLNITIERGAKECSRN